MAEQQEAEFTVLQHPPAWGLPSACAACLRVRAVLLLAGARHRVEDCPRMPDSELLPILEHGVDVAYPTSGEGPLGFLRSRGIDLDASLQEGERAELEAFTSLVDCPLEDALQYMLWMEPSNEVVVLQPYSAVLPWPLNRISAWQEMRKMKQKFTVGRSKPAVAAELYSKAEKAYSALAFRLGTQKHFFVERPSSLDAAVFAHVIFVLRAPLSENPLKAAIEKHPNLQKFAETLLEELFKSEIPREAPPFSRVTASSQKAAAGSEGEAQKKDEASSQRRRARYFLLAQAASVALWVLLSSLSVEVEDADVADDDDNEDL